MPCGTVQSAPVGAVGTAEIVTSTGIGVSYTSEVKFSVSAVGKGWPARMVMACFSFTAKGADKPAGSTPRAS